MSVKRYNAISGSWETYAGYSPSGSFSAITGTFSSNLTASIGTFTKSFIGQAFYGTTGSTSLSNPVLVARDTGATYIQMAVVNSSASGSSDYAAYGDTGDDVSGWVDMGFTGSAFSDPNYTITGSNDGYVFAAGKTGTGNLVLATNNTGTKNDLVFGTGGFTTSNEVMRYSNSASFLNVIGYASFTKGITTPSSIFIGGDILLSPTTTNSPATFNTLEYGGGASVLYQTGATASNRGIIAKYQIISSSTNFLAAGSSTTAQNWFAGDSGATTASTTISNLSAVYLEGGVAYQIKGILHLSRAAGAISHTTAIQLWHPASATSLITYTVQSTATTGNALGTVSAIRGTSFGNTIATAANTSTTENNMFVVDGVVRTASSGWLVPRFVYSNAPGGPPTVTAGSYFEAIPIGASWSTNSYEAI